MKERVWQREAGISWLHLRTASLSVAATAPEGWRWRLDSVGGRLAEGTEATQHLAERAAMLEARKALEVDLAALKGAWG